MTVSNIGEVRQELSRIVTQYGLEMNCPPSGVVSAQIAIVGEAPTAKECQMREPFAGGAGKEIVKAFNRPPMRLSRNAMYSTHVVKRHVTMAGGAYKHKKDIISKHELEHWRDILRHELSMLPNLETVFVLGETALYAVTGNKGISNWRGSVLDVVIDGRKLRVVCSINPSMIFRDPKLEVLFAMDVGDKLKRVVNGEWQKPVINKRINPTFAEACTYLDEALHAGLLGELVSIDLESMAKMTACVGISYMDGDAMCINFRDKLGSRYSVAEEVVLRQKIQRIAIHPNIKRVGQNLNFDAGWMGYMDRIRFGKTYIDTMLAHHLLYPQMPHGLGFLTTQYTDHPYYKDDGTTWRIKDDIDQFWGYNCDDAALTRMIAVKVIAELHEAGMWDFYNNHIAHLGQHLVAMTVAGCRIDTAKKAELSEQLTLEVATVRKEFMRLAGELLEEPDFHININSQKQLKQLFFSDLRLVGGNGLSLDAESRTKLKLHPRTGEKERQLLELFDTYQEKNKFLSTYVATEIDADERMRCEFKQTGVAKAPGRLSSSGNLWGTGCVTGDTEVLTVYGWKRIDEVAQTQHTAIAVWQNGEVFFDVPEGYHVEPQVGLLQVFNSSQMSAVLTPGHRMLFTKRDNYYVRTAEEASKLTLGNVPVSGKYLGGGLHDPSFLQRVAMVSADAHHDEGKRWVIRVKKKRKVLRMRELLEGMQYNETQISRGYTRVMFKEQVLTKTFGPWLLQYDIASLEAFIEECGNWDAHRRGKSYVYCTTVEDNATWVQIIAHLTGRGATIIVDETNSNEYGNTSTKPLYLVNVKPRNTVCVEAHNWSTQLPDTSKKVYCPMLGDRAWLMRHNGKVSVTLNCNAQNQPEAAKCMWIADPQLDGAPFAPDDPEGWGLTYFDAAQIEARFVAYFANIQTWKEQFQRDLEYRRGLSNTPYDAHRALAADLWKIPYDQVPKEDFLPDGTKTIRYYAKRSRHGLNYRMMPPTFAVKNQFSLQEATELFNMYHRETPELVPWWEETVREFKTNGVIYSPMGRRMIALGRIDDSLLDSIVAFRPQSTAGDHIASVIYLAHEDPEWPVDARIWINVHDMLMAIHKHKDRQLVRRILRKYAERPIIIRGEECIVPVDFAYSMPDETGLRRWSTLKKVKNDDE